MEKILAENYYKNRTGLLNYIKSKVNQLEIAEDILHDVYLQAMNSLTVTEPVENLFGWLFTVANNKIIDWYRKKSRQTVPLEEYHTLKEIFAIDEGRDMDDQSRKIVTRAIMGAIEKLPMEQKNVFIMHVIEEKPFKEIAGIENVSINTVLARKRYAIKNLRKTLDTLKDEFIK